MKTYVRRKPIAGFEFTPLVRARAGKRSETNNADVNKYVNPAMCSGTHRIRYVLHTHSCRVVVVIDQSTTTTLCAREFDTTPRPLHVHPPPSPGQPPTGETRADPPRDYSHTFGRYGFFGDILP